MPDLCPALHPHFHPALRCSSIFSPQTAWLILTCDLGSCCALCSGHMGHSSTSSLTVGSHFGPRVTPSSRPFPGSPFPEQPAHPSVEFSAPSWHLSLRVSCLFMCLCPFTGTSVPGAKGMLSYSQCVFLFLDKCLTQKLWNK